MLITVSIEEGRKEREDEEMWDSEGLFFERAIVDRLDAQERKSTSPGGISA